MQHNGPQNVFLLEKLAELFKVLGDLTRVRILSLLSGGEVCVHELADRLDMEQPAVSHQLRNLRAARLIKGRRVGKHIYYSLDDEHVEKIFEMGCEHIAEF